jgi:hypothetical protein
MKFGKRELVKIFGLYSFLTYLVFCITALIILHEQYYQQCWVIIPCVIIIYLYPILGVGFIFIILFFPKKTEILLVQFCSSKKIYEPQSDKNGNQAPPLSEESKCSVKLEVNEEFRRGVNTPPKSDGASET